MKTLKFTTLLLALAIVFGSTSCKYEDGPALSLRTKTSRIAREWNIEKYVDANGIETTETDSPVYEFDKDGNLKVTYTYLGTTTSFDGKWEFVDSKKSVKITFDGDSETEEILRLTSKELWLKYSDGEETHFKAK